ncbi:FecR domain-containing protein [Haloferula sp. A504]|uniref:FecR domain-containing protein n=1 Tax=Haloferula sp. A504 TaxID=3373601 RepID=UPI0031C9E3EC|nr:FecR family protein [Verrucomicrobiaceae bacterium E54]
MSRRKLEMLLDELFEGRIEGGDFERLQAELRANPEARQAYRETLNLEHALRFRAKGVDLLNVVPMEKVVERRQRRVLRHALGAAAAVVVLGAVAMALILTRTPPPAVTFETSPGTEWMMSHAATGEEAPDGRVMEPGSRLVLEQGTMELDFASGVRGIVSGPADLTLLREDLVDLGHGTVWFEVPEKAVGFQVRTPDLVLTDLGTAFGIVSKDNFLDEVHVFDGEVEVLHRRGVRHEERIREGGARSADPAGRWQEIPLRPGDFRTELPETSSAPIVVDDTATFTTSPGNGMVRKDSFTFTIDGDLAGFDPEGSDKLVATFSHERGAIDEVTYGGVRMALAARSTSGSEQETAIYHLDAPGVAGDMVVRFKGAANGVGGSLLALSNTAPGGPLARASSTSSQARLAVEEAGCVVVASHAFNGNGKDDSARALAPVVPVFSGPTGSSAGGSGYLTAIVPGEVELKFAGGSLYPSTSAAAFAPRR